MTAGGAGIDETGTSARGRFDERVLGAGTTIRFVLLVVLLLVASGSMILQVASYFAGSSPLSCLLASGRDPGDAAYIAEAFNPQSAAYEECVRRFAQQPPWWLIVGWPVLLLGATAGLFLGLPAWRARRSRVVPLAAVDLDGVAAVTRLAAVAGLARPPRVVVDLTADSTSAVVFGSNRHPIVSLHGGLIACRTTEPHRFAAVVLHELAHIRNGDVTLTYATVALWRVFVALVLLPYTAMAVITLVGHAGMLGGAPDAPASARFLVLAVIMVALVYLARSDVLRSREVHADLAAVRWGAAQDNWTAMIDTPGPRGMRPSLAAFAELWRSHPRWDLRRDALADPVALFGLRGLPMFLTGFAAVLLHAQTWDYLGRYGPGSVVLDQVRSLVPAALATGVAGIMLWRAVAYALLTGRPRVPSGVRAGLWLGLGMAFGELVLNRSAIYQWLPTHPELLLVVVLVGVLFGWWTAQCAQLWARTWPGRTLRPAMLLGLAGAWLVLWSWFTWWQSSGMFMLNGWPFNSGAVRDLLAEMAPTVATAHEATLTAISSVVPAVAMPLTRSPIAIALPAVAVLCVVPLLAWLVRPVAGSPRWMRAAQPGDDYTEPLPPLRRVLLPALCGGVACWVAVAGLMAWLHTWRPPDGQRAGPYQLIYQGWLLVAVVAAATVAAVVVSVLTNRYRLLLGLVAAQTTTMMGLAGVFVLAAVDGCVGPLNTLRSSCAWRPTGPWQTLEFPVLAGASLVAAAVAAAAAVAVVCAIRRPQPDEPGRRRDNKIQVAGRRLCASVLCALLVGITVAEQLPVAQNPAGVDTILGSYGLATLTVRAAPVSAGTRRVQVLEWLRRGGADLLDRISDDVHQIGTAVQAATRTVRNNTLDLSRVHALCTDLVSTAQSANEYFHIPDSAAQSLWQQLLDQLQSAGEVCRDTLARDHDLIVLETRDADIVLGTLKEFNQSAKTYDALNDRFIAIAHNGG